MLRTAAWVSSGPASEWPAGPGEENLLNLTQITCADWNPIHSLWLFIKGIRDPQKVQISNCSCELVDTVVARGRGSTEPGKGSKRLRRRTFGTTDRAAGTPEG